MEESTNLSLSSIRAVSAAHDVIAGAHPDHQERRAAGPAVAETAAAEVDLYHQEEEETLLKPEEYMEEDKERIGPIGNDDDSENNRDDILQAQWRDAMAAMAEEELEDEEEEEEEAVEEDVPEEEEEPIDQEELPLPDIMSQDSPLRMSLSKDERNWALEIKDAIELMGPDLTTPRPIKDYDMAQLAIICRDDVNDAVDRVEALQSFRQEYRITDTLEQGYRAVEQFMRDLLPGYIMGWFFSPTKGAYVVAADCGKFSISQINTVERMDRFFVGYYYIFQAFTPDLESIRKGIEIVAECGKMPYTTKRDYDLAMRMFRELMSFYPFTATQKVYNTGVIFNMMYSVMKMLLPKKLRDKMQVGLSIEGGLHIHQIFQVPDEATASQQALQNIQNNLRRRYENELTFALQ